ncbi:MAG TPA: hypothetical protein VMN78_06170 [Longimicrobiales bacterium]|nr:hypothetical protein [Longimicrobiales bacterium]
MYRYLDARGMTKRLAHESDLAAAMRSGDVHARTMLASGESGPWQPAARHPDFQRIAKLEGIRTTGGGASRSAGRSRLAFLGDLSPRSKLAALAVLMLLAFGGLHARARAERNQLIDSLQQAMLDLSEGRAPSADVLTDEPPDDLTAKLLWIRVRAEDDVRAGVDSAIAAQGIDGFDPPSVWMTDEYLRNAGDYPAVGRHWEAYNRFHSSYAARIPDLTRSAVFRWGIVAGLRPPHTNEINERVEAEMPGRMRRLQARSQVAGSALELHRALADSRGRVVLNRDSVLEFEDSRALGAYNGHLPTIRGATRTVNVFDGELSPIQVAMLNAPMGRRLESASSASSTRDAVRRTLDEIRNSRGARGESVEIPRSPAYEEGRRAAEEIQQRARGSNYGTRTRPPARRSP